MFKFHVIRLASEREDGADPHSFFRTLPPLWRSRVLSNEHIRVRERGIDNEIETKIS